MYSLFEKGVSLFARRAPQNSVRIVGYDAQTVTDLYRFKLKNNFKFIDVTDPKIFRGVSVEHYLGSLEHSGLGMTTMRPSFARFLKSKGYTCLDDLSPAEKKAIMEAHVHGYSLTKGNSTKVAHSYSYSASVALCFGIDAARKSNFPETSIIGIARKFCSKTAWNVEYDPLSIHGEEQGTSIFSYQCEAIVPYLFSPIHHCIVVNQKQPDMIHLDDLKQAKRFDVSESSILELSIIPAEKIKKYQHLEIDKVIAYDDFVTYVCENNNQKDPKAIELYEKYKSILKEQTALIDVSLCERDQWVNVASAVAPKTYTCISAHTNGFTIELPTKNGGVFVANISNIEAVMYLAPLFEADPRLTLEQVKHGEVPCALNYLTESVIRKNKDLVCQTGLEKCIEEEQNPTINLS
ncbi:hypothetical protein LEAN103870_07720 [Legionella anisa]|uniref:Uncharacterized protein n=1 Tax=Legionella anisa TaxID=28082 RepID=A0AAX0WUH3_9GAMM|nr:hypothetical protein [Legionella anisa]AWN74505.1 hypothetical protein DLD14_11980 [Legionella anisa]KTC76569.1 hypothetical protein Lani_0299 [Legionella anisa]MBN5935713.1 hypothetical protein [Legionella anisa]MCW8425382.1 hypothetical protein [Legionella anisa]MCW8449187.1 hypothetical protein [Legionella anisa]